MWQRRQKILPQQVTTELALIEGIERTNTVVVRGQEQGQGIEAPRRDPYAMEIEQRKGLLHLWKIQAHGPTLWK